MKNLFKKSSGFTLIELMVVIVILGVLATMLFGSFVTSQKKARDLRRKSDLNQIAKALEFYYNDSATNKYPTSSVDGTGRIVGCSSQANSICSWGLAWKNTNSSGVETTYMVAMPKDPGGYSYYYESNGNQYQLYARLENKLDGDIVSQVGSGMAYPGTACGAFLCEYGISSSNTNPLSNGINVHSPPTADSPN